MGRRRTITKQDREFIMTALLEPQHNGTKLTAERLYKSRVKDLKDTKTPLPGKSAFIKEVTEVRKQLEQQTPSELENKWSIGSCIKYDIDSEMIPILVLLQAKQPTGEISIRVARWFSKLYPALENVFGDSLPAGMRSEEAVYLTADIYARYERICEIDGVEVDTTELDVMTFFNPIFSQSPKKDGEA